MKLLRPRDTYMCILIVIESTVYPWMYCTTFGWILKTTTKQNNLSSFSSLETWFVGKLEASGLPSCFVAPMASKRRLYCFAPSVAQRAAQDTLQMWTNVVIDIIAAVCTLRPSFVHTSDCCSPVDFQAITHWCTVWKEICKIVCVFFFLYDSDLKFKVKFFILSLYLTTK